MRRSHENNNSHPLPLQERTITFDEDSDLGSPKKIKLSSTEHEGCSFSDPPPSHFILCGRGERTNRHPGNKIFRRLVDQNRSLYHSGTKKRKGLIATSIVEAIYRHDQPGRFVRQDKKSKLWFDVGIKQAIKKTSQALREIVPEKKNDGDKSATVEITSRNPVSSDDELEFSEGDEEGDEDEMDFTFLEGIEMLANAREGSLEHLQLPDERVLPQPLLIYQTSDFTFGTIPSFSEGNDSAVPPILNFSFI